MHLGIDIGGTKTDAVVVDADGAVRARRTLPSGRGAAAVIAAALEAARDACAQVGVEPASLTIGIGTPGTVVDGVVSHALNLQVDRLDLAGAIEAALGARPTVDNDVNAAALGAYLLAGGGERSMAYLNLGTGLAAGLVLDGRLWRGSRGAAGEIGHVSVDPAGPIGSDGLPGGLETYASGAGLTLQWGVDGASGADVVAAAAAGDARARAICDGAMFGLASAVRVLVLTLDVDEVVVAGGMTAWGDELIGGARRLLDAWAATSPFLASLDLAARMRPLELEVPVAAIGAAMRGGGHG
ncbi:ROK family protein [Demequina sp. SYSU T00039]|uniref:ROK family protein n=1 Tax=Demequina lignilytica TaxID=3051663 RepID=A0AAW7M5Q5_9MICO|nr:MULTISPECIES: ROK family protein [unclassified Demequina]MDN4478208.1 ROK family protein [Demequina sp. SYSU T00039-1]MDN4488342.1 ROK family protein [Demequina sp. SYSU T00039]MDN4490111.1 ROK family protein [Demequina sp. SYSU T00068]